MSSKGDATMMLLDYYFRYYCHFKFYPKQVVLYQSLLQKRSRNHNYSNNKIYETAMFQLQLTYNWGITGILDEYNI